LGDHERQQQSVPVARIDPAETGTGEQPAQSPGRDAADVMYLPVVARQQPAIRGHVDDEQPARAQHPPQRRQGRHRFDQFVTQNVGRYGGVEALVGEGQPVDRTAGHRRRRFGVRALRGSRLAFDADQCEIGPGCGDHAQQAAGAATGVEHPASHGGERVEQAGVEGAIPPQVRLVGVHKIVFRRLHGIAFDPIFRFRCKPALPCARHG